MPSCCAQNALLLPRPWNTLLVGYVSPAHSAVMRHQVNRFFSCLLARTRQWEVVVAEITLIQHGSQDPE